MELQDQLELGRQAKEFQSYININPYFYKLLEREKLRYVGEILSLNPKEKDDFSLNRMAIIALDDLENTFKGDISLGEMAEKRLSGEPEKGGLL